MSDKNSTKATELPEVYSFDNLKSAPKSGVRVVGILLSQILESKSELKMSESWSKAYGQKKNGATGRTWQEISELIKSGKLDTSKYILKGTVYGKEIESPLTDVLKAVEILEKIETLYNDFYTALGVKSEETQANKPQKELEF